MEADSVWVIQAHIAFSVYIDSLYIFTYLHLKYKSGVYNLHRLVSIKEGNHHVFSKSIPGEFLVLLLQILHIQFGCASDVVVIFTIS